MMNTMDQYTFSTEPTLATQWVHSRWFRIFLVTALGLGVFFRIAGLGNKMYSHDEIYTSLHAAAGHRTRIAFVSLWDGKDKTVEELQSFLKPDQNTNSTEALSVLALTGPQQSPLFFLIAYYWMRIIGYTPAAMRGLAALFGLFSIPAMYWFSKELFKSSRTALLSTALFALSPFHILFAQDARYYSLWTLATLLSSAAFLRAMQKNNFIHWFTYSLTLILGIYSHQLFVLVAFAHGLYLVITYFRHSRKGFTGFLSASLFAVLAYSPWLLLTISHWQAAADQMDWVNIWVPWYRYIQRWILLFSSPFIDLDLNSNTANLVPYVLRALMLILLAYALLFLFRHGSRQEKLFLSLIYLITSGTFIFLDLFLGGIRSIAGRYYVPANLASILVVAYFLASGLDRSNINTKLRWKSLIATLVFFSVLSNVNSLLAETWWNKELGRVRSEFIHEIDKDQTLLIVSGTHPTNLGDVLLLGSQVDSDVHFRLFEDTEIDFTGNYQNIYWFPSSYEEFKIISEKKDFQASEVIQGTLWLIDRMSE